MTAPTHYYNNPAFLAIRLKALRRRMNMVGKEKGFAHPHTLALSRRVDELINELQREVEKP